MHIGTDTHLEEFRNLFTGGNCVNLEIKESVHSWNLHEFRISGICSLLEITRI